MPVRSGKQLELIKFSGKITARVLKKVLARVRPGVSLLELEKIADEEIIGLGGRSAFKSVPGYFWTTCLTVNEEVVHGIPRDRKLKQGDILSVDLGAVFEGWYTDAAWTVLVKDKTSIRRLADKDQKEKERFLRVGEKALWAAISQAREGRRLGDISAVIGKTIEKSGYNVVRSYTGHGVGQSAHEEPEIHCFGESGTGMKLKSGMTLAIEVIYTAGDGRVVLGDDGWTAVSADGSLGGLFEMTVIVGKKRAEVITEL